MTTFVSGYTQGCRCGSRIDTLGKTNHIGLGVEVVGKITCDTLDANITQTVFVQDGSCYFAASHAGTDALLGVFREGGIDSGACPKRKSNGRQNQNNVGPINVEHSVILLFLGCDLVIVGPELHQGGFVTGPVYQITHAMFGTGDDQ